MTNTLWFGLAAGALWVVTLLVGKIQEQPTAAPKPERKVAVGEARRRACVSGSLVAALS